MNWVIAITLALQRQRTRGILGKADRNDYAPSFARTLLPDLQAAGVLNFEMESSALLTVSTLYGLRAGAILQLSRIALTTHFRSPVSNKQWRLNRAAILLAKMDREKTAAGVKFWHPGLVRR